MTSRNENRDDQRLAVQTAQGRVRGKVSNGARSFYGVPYAADPVGQLRWRPPQSHVSWEGVRDATQRGPALPQRPSRLDGVMGNPTSAYDEVGALHLNVFAPLDAHNLPVLVWVHGGGWMSGSSAWPWYDGSLLAAEQNIVVVTISYRHGPLGYLYLGDRSDGLAPGNMGNLDQIAALSWVGENIAAFGGDPYAIAVGGQSAGAHSSVMLAESPATRGLVKRLILESPAPYTLPRTAEQGLAVSRALLDELQIGPHDVDRLATIEIEPVLAAFEQIKRRQEPGDLENPFRMVDDGWLVSETLFESLNAHIDTEVDVLLGTTQQELGCFLRQAPNFDAITAERAKEIVDARFGEANAKILLDAYSSIVSEAAPFYAMEAVLGDAQFLVPVLDTAAASAARGRRTFLYQFNWQNSVFGSCHCIELPFLFGNYADWRESPMLGPDPDASSGPLGKNFRSSIAEFVRTGSPGWAAYDTDGRPTMVFDTHSELITDPAEARRGAFARAGVKLSPSR
ncbi:carboxylesterase/lipase family protein [Nocardia salmonicida]|uniref:carboxylesterase/lipase family protein n=1 Tax=Nocardia salmonicida TaxID=53431 RepID=UPI003671DDE5